jgi:hypothetical protein
MNKGRQSLGNKFRASQGEGELLLSLLTEVDQPAISPIYLSVNFSFQFWDGRIAEREWMTFVLLWLVFRLR